MTGYNPFWKAPNFSAQRLPGEARMLVGSQPCSAPLSPLRSLGTPRGLGAAGRGLCWECLSRCSLRRHHRALSACRSGGHSSVAWSARRQKVQLLRPNALEGSTQIQEQSLQKSANRDCQVSQEPFCYTASKEICLYLCLQGRIY